MARHKPPRVKRAIRRPQRRHAWYAGRVRGAESLSDQLSAAVDYVRVAINGREGEPRVQDVVRGLVTQLVAAAVDVEGVRR